MSRWTLEGLRSRQAGFALGPVHCELGPGRSVAIVGPSGAGKTTLLRTVAGFVPATDGRVVCDDIDLTGAPPERREIGYVPQGLGLFPHRTVAENVAYPLRVRANPDAAARARALLERFGLTELAGRRPGTLSSGQAQKVALARALAAGPRLLLWDEPAHALDVLARDELAGVFHDLGRAEGTPLILVTHDPVLAFSLADRFVLLRDGRVDFVGTSAEMIARPPDLYAARFAGFENLFGTGELATAGAGLGGWLAERAGPGGVAFRTVVLGDAVGQGRWEGLVDTVRPTPDGTRVELACGGLRVRALAPGPVPAGGPAVGARVRFDLDPDELRPLGGGTDAPPVSTPATSPS